MLLLLSSSLFFFLFLFFFSGFPSQASLSDYLLAQMTFFARGLEILSEAHKQINHISPEIDLKVI